MFFNVLVLKVSENYGSKIVLLYFFYTINLNLQQLANENLKQIMTMALALQFKKEF